MNLSDLKNQVHQTLKDHRKGEPWPPGIKKSVLEHCETRGVSVPKLAGELGLSSHLIYSWRNSHRASSKKRRQPNSTNGSVTVLQLNDPSEDEASSRAFSLKLQLGRLRIEF